MRKFGLIGYPLGHSFSKTYFAEKFSKEHISDCSYENFPIRSLDLLPKLITDEPDLAGLNVTIPYKSEIFRYIDDIDNEAGEIGALNVIKIRRAHGRIKLSGFNSDINGIYDSLVPFKSANLKYALVLGTGGSSRAVCHVLKKLGTEIFLVSRSKKPGTIVYSEIDSDILAKVRLIINTTPLGMFPDLKKKPDIKYDLLNDRHILFDIVYNPELTLFLREGMERGCRIITGLKMLYSQAERSWQIWNDESL